MKSRWTVLATGGVIIAGVGTLWWLIPPFDLPVPTGPYPVGVISLEVPARQSIPIRIWYPARSVGNARARYETFGAAPHRFPQLPFIRTHATEAPPCAAASVPWPVLLFSPAWGGNYSQNTFLVEDLASHGYVVVAMEHPGDATVVRGPGQTARHVAPRRFLDFSSEDTFRETLRGVEEQLENRVAQAEAVLDFLQRLDQGDGDGRFRGRLGLSAIGALGHSFGGALAAELCRRDARVKAGVNLDGLMFKDVLRFGPGKPFFFGSSFPFEPSAGELHSSDAALRRSAAFAQQSADVIRATLHSQPGGLLILTTGNHGDFTDMPLYSHWKRLSGSGSINPLLAMRLVRAHTLALFDCTLRNQCGGLAVPPVHTRDYEFLPGATAEYTAPQAKTVLQPLR